MIDWLKRRRALHHLMLADIRLELAEKGSDITECENAYTQMCVALQEYERSLDTNKGGVACGDTILH